MINQSTLYRFMLYSLNMELLITTLQHWIQFAGGLGVFAASIVEEVISLIPSSAVQMGAGIFIMGGVPISLFAIGKLLIEIALPAALGVTLGSLPYVWLARKYGLLMIDKWGKWIGVSVHDIRNLEEKLAKTAWDDIAFVAMRAFPVIPSVALAVYGGIIEMSWWRYILLSFIGVFIRATGLATIGWLFGNAAGSVAAGMGTLENIGLLVIGFTLIFFWWTYRNKKKKS